jgi:hypothetical protein
MSAKKPAAEKKRPDTAVIDVIEKPAPVGGETERGEAIGPAGT